MITPVGAGGGRARVGSPANGPSLVDLLGGGPFVRCGGLATLRGPVAPTKGTSTTMTYNQPPPPPPYYPPPPPPPQKKSRKGLWITLGVVALLFVGCGAIVSNAASNLPAVPTTAAPAPGAQAPAPAPAEAPAPVVPAEPSGPLTAFGNGAYLVGEDVAAGTYRSPGVEDSIAPLCYWDLTDDSGAIKDQGVANEGPSRATLREGLTFKSQGCQDWAMS